MTHWNRKVTPRKIRTRSGKSGKRWPMSQKSPFKVKGKVKGSRGKEVIYLKLKIQCAPLMMSQKVGSTHVCSLKKLPVCCEFLMGAPGCYLLLVLHKQQEAHIIFFMSLGFVVHSGKHTGSTHQFSQSLLHRKFTPFAYFSRKHTCVLSVRAVFSKVQKSSGDNCQKILTNWLYPPQVHLHEFFYAMTKLNFRVTLFGFPASNKGKLYFILKAIIEFALLYIKM